MKRTTEYRIKVRSGFGRPYRMLNEGPWETRLQAEEFADAEVGCEWTVVETPKHRHDKTCIGPGSECIAD